MRILVTGVAGFIGSNLAEALLQRGHTVIGIDNLSYGVQEQVHNDVEFYNLDIRSAKIYPLFQNVEAVFHLAAKNCISDCQADPQETAEINISGSINVFEASYRQKVQKVIYAESSAVYEGSSVFPTPESQTYPESFYAMSKLASGLFANAYQRFFGLSMTGLRYFCVYGPRQDYRRTVPPVMSAFIIRLLRGEAPIIFGTGEKRRDFVHVDDVNAFHLQCLTDERTAGKVFNLGSGRSYSVNEIYQKICTIVGIKLPAEYHPELQGEAMATLSDNSEAMKLGWKPTVGIDEGIMKMVDWIRSHHVLGSHSTSIC